MLTYVTGLGDGQGCAAGPAEGRDPYPGGTNPPGAPSPAPGAPVALHLPSRDCGHPCPHSLAGPGTTTRPTFHGPVSAERSRGPQCTHFYCGVIPTAVKSHFSHFPPWLPVFFVSTHSIFWQFAPLFLLYSICLQLSRQIRVTLVPMNHVLVITVSYGRFFSM